MPVDLIIRSGELVTTRGVEHGDLAVDGGRIVAMGSLNDSARRTIDATGLHVFPGVIDPHVHFNEPGRTEWEGFDSGTAAFAAGGGSCFFDMPLNSSPPVLDAASFDAKLQAGLARSRTDFALWGGLTPGHLDQLEALADKGVVGFKAFMSGSGIDDFQAADDLTLLRGMEIAASLKLPVAVHAESETLTQALTAEARAKGETSWASYVASRPPIAEVAAVQRAILFAKETGCRLHIVHVSTVWAAQLVRAARVSQGIDVTCETCPHYLSFTLDDLPRLGAKVKCAPPLRDAEEVTALWHELEADTFAFVASDHSPAPPVMKEVDDAFAAWGGIAGVQSTLPVLLSRTPELALPQIAGLTSTQAARRFGLQNKGDLAVGMDADAVLIDLSQTDVLTSDDLLDRHRANPYVGRAFRGRVMRTMVRGVDVCIEGEPTGAFTPRLVTPSRSTEGGQ